MSGNIVNESRASEGTSFLTPMQNESVVDRIISQLTDAIISGALKPGQRIPTEKELCESLQVGRNSVREAIKALVAMGVLNIRRSEGTFVADGFSERMLEPLAYGMVLEGGNTSAMLDFRRMFESGILDLAIEKATEKDIVALQKSLDRIAEAVKPPTNAKKIMEADISFHRTLVKILHNPLVDKISSLIERVSLPTRMLAVQHFIDNGESESMFDLHREMLQTIEKRDKSCVWRIMEDHFRYWSKELK